MALTIKDIEYREYERDTIIDPGRKELMLEAVLTLTSQHVRNGIELSAASKFDVEKELKKNLYLSIADYVYGDLDEPFRKLSKLVLRNITVKAEQDEVVNLMTEISEIIQGGNTDETH